MNHTQKLNTDQLCALVAVHDAGDAGLHCDGISLQAFYSCLELVQLRLLRYDAASRHLHATDAGRELIARGRNA